MVVRPKLPVMGPTGAGPYPPFYDTPQQGRMGFSDFDKLFDNYDDGSYKMGYPYTTLFGSKVEVVGRCPKCLNFMVMKPMEDKPGTSVGVKMQPFCPFCRPQLTVGDPKAEKLNYNPLLESPDPMEKWNDPLDSECLFDPRYYPSQGPSMSGNQAY